MWILLVMKIPQCMASTLMQLHVLYNMNTNHTHTHTHPYTHTHTCQFIEGNSEAQQHTSHSLHGGSIHRFLDQIHTTRNSQNTCKSSYDSIHELPTVGTGRRCTVGLEGCTSQKVFESLHVSTERLHHISITVLSGFFAETLLLRFQNAMKLRMYQ